MRSAARGAESLGAAAAESKLQHSSSFRYGEKKNFRPPLATRNIVHTES